MNLQDAVKTGKPFRKAGQEDWIEDATTWCKRFSKQNHGLFASSRLREATFIRQGDDDAYPYRISASDILRTDWEVRP